MFGLTCILNEDTLKNKNKPDMLFLVKCSKVIGYLRCQVNRIEPWRENHCLACNDSWLKIETDFILYSFN